MRIVDHIKRYEQFLTPDFLEEREQGGYKEHYIRRKN